MLGVIQFKEIDIRLRYLEMMNATEIYKVTIDNLATINEELMEINIE
jgi:hypothetical protein